MASTLTLVSAQPNSLKYLYTADSASQDAVISKATLLADAATAAQGPSVLLAWLAGLSDAAWLDLQKTAEISLYITPQAETLAATQISGRFGGGIFSSPQLVISGLGQTTSDKALVEIRFNHSLVR